MDAPDRIWIERDDECPYFYREEELADAAPPLVEYVKATEMDILKDQIAAQARDWYARVAELEADLWRVRDAYNELIMAVGMKFPDESRHQTALRYIRQREAGGSVQCAVKEGE